MAEPEPMNNDARQFVESMGLYYEQYDLPRIGGRILGLLLIAERPLSLDDMATRLGVSRASISTNVRMAVSYGLAELITLPGDRRDYYRYPENAWERGIRMNIEAIQVLRRLAERGLAVAASENEAAQARFADLLDFCDFSLEDLSGMLERWRERYIARLRDTPA